MTEEKEQKEEEKEKKTKPKKAKAERVEPERIKVELLTDRPPVDIKVGGLLFKMYPPKMEDPYVRLAVRAKGLMGLAAPKPASLKAARAMIEARIAAKKLTPEAGERILEEQRLEQEKALASAKEVGNEAEAAKIMAAEAADETRTVFARTVDDELAIECRSVKAMLRECLTEGGLTMKYSGKALKERLKHVTGIYGADMNPGLIKIMRNGTPLKAPDEERRQEMVHAKDKTGQPLDGISVFEYIDVPWYIDFIIGVAKNATLEPNHIVEALRFLPTISLAAKRPMGYGSLILEVVSEPVLDSYYYQG